MRRTTLFIFLLLAAALHAQQEFRGRVVDAETGEPLPYATIFIAGNRGALSNENGEFLVPISESDTLHISCVGYNKTAIPAWERTDILRLKPLTQHLKEVTVTAVTTREILRRTSQQLKKEAEKWRDTASIYFFRNRFVGKNKTRIQEGFMAAKSYCNLRDFVFLNARRHNEGEDSTETHLRSTNIHRLMELGARTIDSELWWPYIKPLSKYRFYHATHITLAGEDGKLVYKIEMPRLTKFNRFRLDSPKLVTGTLYVDADNYRLLRFDGKVEGLTMRSFFIALPTELTFQIGYTHENGFTEVSHISMSGGNEETKFRSTLFNIGLYDEQKRTGVNVGENMIQTIDEVGYDVGVWRNLEIILRTAEDTNKRIESIETGTIR